MPSKLASIFMLIFAIFQFGGQSHSKERSKRGASIYPVFGSGTGHSQFLSMHDATPFIGYLGGGHSMTSPATSASYSSYSFAPPPSSYSFQAGPISRLGMASSSFDDSHLARFSISPYSMTFPSSSSSSSRSSHGQSTSSSVRKETWASPPPTPALMDQGSAWPMWGSTPVTSYSSPTPVYSGSSYSGPGVDTSNPWANSGSTQNGWETTDYGYISPNFANIASGSHSAPPYAIPPASYPMPMSYNANKRRDTGTVHSVDASALQHSAQLSWNSQNELINQLLAHSPRSDYSKG